MSVGERRGWLGRLRDGLSRSSGALKERISEIFVGKELDAGTLEALEEALILSDLGQDAAAHFVAELARGRFGKTVTDREIREALAEILAAELAPNAVPLPRRAELRPQVVLVCGVNGTGKTTTIGKLAKQATDEGLRVVLAACDTFRAAAVEQLQIWGQRNGVPVIAAKTGSDPSSLAFQAYEEARRDGADLLLIDTAGRLHNRQELMDELTKMVRALRKVDGAAPHDVLLVLDGTTGQNAHAQVETFRALVDVTGLIVTKLDGTAKAGVVVALAQRFDLPIHAIGVGERIEDLRPFEAKSFARALMGLGGHD